jgi:hypothetical protein
VGEPVLEQRHGDEEPACYEREVVDFGDGEVRAGHGVGFLVEALESEAHGWLGTAVVPDDVEKGEEVGVPAAENALCFGACR